MSRPGPTPTKAHPALRYEIPEDDEGVLVREWSPALTAGLWPCPGCGEHRLIHDADILDHGPELALWCGHCRNRLAAERAAADGLS